MANQEHLDILLSGVNIWNSWRIGMPWIIPNLSGANLRNADLRKANLQKATLEGASLLEAELRGANLKGADLCGAELRKAILYKVNLGEANLQGAFLQGAFLQKANLQDANLQDAFLRWANLEKANLQGANLQGAQIKFTRFTSRNALNDLASPLTDEQLFGCVFADEEKRRKQRKQANKRFGTNLPPLPAVRVHFTRCDWTPETLAMYMLRVQLAFDRFTYLATTEEQDQDTLWRIVSGRCLQDDSRTIHIDNISTGSLIFDLTYSALEIFTKKELKAMVLVSLLGSGALLGLEGFKTYEEAMFLRAQRHEIEQSVGAKHIVPLSKSVTILPRNLLPAQKSLKPFVTIPEKAEVPNPVVMTHKEAFFGMAAHPLQDVIERENEQDEKVMITLEGTAPWEKRFDDEGN